MSEAGCTPGHRGETAPFARFGGTLLPRGTPHVGYRPQT